LKSIINAKINSFISRVLWRFGYAKVLYKDRRTPSFSDLEAFQSQIFEVLMAGIKMDNSAKMEHMQDLARSLISKIAKEDSLSISEFTNLRLGPVFTGRKITYTLCAGIACFWEVQVKFLAQQIGINIYESSNRKNAKSPSIRDIDPIIEDIKEKLPNLEFNFGRLVNIRNATVHGNFHQIRTMAAESQKREIRDSFKGNVFVFKLNEPGSGQNLSEIKELENIKEAGLFSWFMDTGVSTLLETVIHEFQDGINLVSSVAAIASHPREGSIDYFDKLCLRGEKLTQMEKDTFLHARKSLDMPVGSNKRSIECIEQSQKI
jgi:hypothetical protein